MGRSTSETKSQISESCAARLRTKIRALTALTLYRTIHCTKYRREGGIHVKWLVIGIGMLMIAGVLRHRMRTARWEQWVDSDA